MKKLLGCLLFLFSGLAFAVLAAMWFLIILLDVPMRYP